MGKRSEQRRKKKEASRNALIRNEQGRLLCPYCDKPAELWPILRVYGRDYGKPDAKYFVCEPCDARVGCHPGTEKPLGNLADATTRQARLKAHAAFDRLWKGKMRRDGVSQTAARRAGYAWLAEQMGITVEYCHIAWMDAEAAEQVAAICAPYHREKDRNMTTTTEMNT